jgi:hypothetical protein
VGTDWPSSGEIEASDSSRFLMNCAAYLATWPDRHDRKRSSSSGDRDF